MHLSVVCHSWPQNKQRQTNLSQIGVGSGPTLPTSTTTGTSTILTTTSTTDGIHSLVSPTVPSTSSPHARIKLRLSCPESGLCLHHIPALRPQRCVSLLLCSSSHIAEEFMLALDTNVPLPLYNSLSHLTYLTSTSPRIREIMTMDGGLERLVRLLHEFCLCPPPPENPAILYGLSAPSAHPTKLVPTLNPKSYDKQAAYRFSLAFQSVVNIGVRGSEQIRGRVVQAGTLDVVGCILEAWLSSKGFAVGAHTTPGGIQRETKEHRMARRAMQAELKQREQAAALARALQRQVVQERTPRAVERSSQTPEVRLLPVLRYFNSVICRRIQWMLNHQRPPAVDDQAHEIRIPPQSPRRTQHRLVRTHLQELLWSLAETAAVP